MVAENLKYEELYPSKIDKETINKALKMTVEIEPSDEYVDGYFRGSFDQNNFDIETACEWFEEFLSNGGTIDEWLRDSPNVYQGKIDFINKMRKNIEEN